MSKMSQISAEMDEQGVSAGERNSALFEKVSEGLKKAEQKIDGKAEPKVKPAIQKEPATSSKGKLIQSTKEFAVKTHNVITSNGKSYVKAPVWQYLAHSLGVIPEFHFDDENTGAVPRKFSDTYVVICTCTLYKDNKQFSECCMIASSDEEFLHDKDAYAVWGMAQTRAFSRAMKNVYGWVVEAAGFCSTPLEEINFKESK